MKVYILGINFYPELTGIAVYNTEMCEYLANLGYKVTVFTAFPYYPHWKVERKYRWKFSFNEIYNNIPVKRSFVYVPKRVTTLKRIFHEVSFIFSSFIRLMFSSPPDLLINVSPPLLLGISSYIFCKIKKTSFIFHIQDLQPDTAVQLGMIKHRIILAFLYKIEKFIYKKALMVSVISKKMKEKIVAKGIEPEKIFFFPNWVDTEYLQPLPRINKFRKINNLEDKFVVLYSGNLGVKQGLDTILEVAAMTKNNENIIHIVVGDGVYKKKLIKKYESLKLKNVLFLPVQSKEMLPYMLSAADVCLIPQQKVVTDVVMPSKLLGIMACGRPVVAGANIGSELCNVINGPGCGIVVEPENTEQMLNAIMEMYRNSEKREEYGRKGREYVIRHFSKMGILRSFEEKIREVVC